MTQLPVNQRMIASPQGFIGLDFETFGAVNLPKYGLDRYVHDPSFEALIVSVDDGNRRQTFDFVRYGETAKEESRPSRLRCTP